jgi:4-hydroxythreonine-4-phosphate dehydrogenase
VIRIAVSIGDPAGIGPEIVGKAKAALPEFDIAVVTPVLGPVTAGQPSDASARIALASLETATQVVLRREADALVTAPVAKANLQSIGFRFPGQTEFLAHACGVAEQDAVMMLAGPSLRTVPLTIHIPVKAVSAALTQSLIQARGRVTATALRRDFGIAHPRLVVAGLNPHAGEGGRIGVEDDAVIRPAVQALQAEGITVRGPLSADTLFHPAARATYDAALCPTHDQALIPIKTLHFDEGVNVTLGLPIIRTSPDHGTAFDIAGKDIANPASMIAAIKLAAEMARRRG